MNTLVKTLGWAVAISLASPIASAGKVSPRQDAHATSGRIHQLKPLPPLRLPAPKPTEETGPSEQTETAPQPLELFGEVQVRMGPPRPVVGAPDDVRANIALGMSVHFSDAVRLDVSGIYQQQVTDPPELDEAYLSIGDLQRDNIQVNIGRLYAPFGTYATDMINDPLTLFMGETKGDGLQVQLQGGPAILQLFAYDTPSTNQDDTQWAARLGIATEAPSPDSGTFEAAISYSSALAAAGTFQDTLSDLSSSPEGLGFLVQWRNATWRFTAEYISSVGQFKPTQLNWKGNGASPAAGHVEAAYTQGRWTTAIATQWTEQAVGLGLPQRRHSLSVQYRLTDNVTIGVEAGQEEDYGPAVGGTGKTDGYVLGQISWSF